MRGWWPLFVDGGRDFHVIHLDVALGDRAVDQLDELGRTRQGSHFLGLAHQVPRVDFTQGKVPLVKTWFTWRGIDSNVLAADSHRGVGVVTGLPAKFQLEAGDAVGLDGCLRGTNANTKRPLVGNQVSEFDDQFLPGGNDGNLVRNRGNPGFFPGRFPRVFCSPVTPRRPGSHAGTQVLVVSAIETSPEPGGLAFEFLFQLFRIVLVFLPGLLQLLLLLGPEIGRGGLHGNAPEDQPRPFSSHRGPQQGLATQLAVRPELDDRHLQVLGAVLKTVFGVGLGRQILGEVEGKLQQVLQGEVVFVTSHSPERRVSLLDASHC